MINRFTVTLAILAGLVLGQVAVSFPAVVCTPFGSLTTTLQLCNPQDGETGWGNAYRNNNVVLDGLFSGSVANPLITLKAVTDPGSPLTGATWLSTTTANSLKYADSGPTTRTLVDLSLTQTLSNKTLTAPVLSGTVTGTYTLGGSPTVGGTLVSYNGNAAANAGAPFQVGAANLSGQTAAITATTLFTPASSGLYRVNYYVVVTTTGTSVNLVLGILSTDDAAARTQNAATVSCAATNFTQGSFIVRATATPIQYQTTMTGTCTYSAFVAVERLS
jgi:hypothetical protein